MRQICGLVPAGFCAFGISAHTQICCCDPAEMLEGLTDVAKPLEMDVIEITVSEYPCEVEGDEAEVANVGLVAV